MAKKLSTPYADLLPPLSTEEFDALRESIKADGVRVPVIVDDDDNVLDGHHRLKIDPDAPRKVLRGLSEAEKQAFVFQANFVRRNLSPSQKKEAARRMREVAKALREEDAKKNTQKRVAMLLGVSRECVSAWWNRGDTSDGTSTNTGKPRPDARVKVSPQAHPVIVERIDAGEPQAQVAADFGVSQQAVSTIVSKERKQKEKAKAREEAAAKIADDTLGVFHGDFRRIGAEVADESVDLIFTDPPYDEDATALYLELSAFAKRVLRPGGWCLSYSGQAWLPQVMAGLGVHLSYGWCFAIEHSGGDLRFRKLKIHNGWKPILGYFKPPLSAWWEWFQDITSGGREKTEHEWQQAESEAAHFIDALCPKQGIVCDPMCGSGTSLVAARKLGFRACGFDADKAAVDTARIRLHDQSAA